MDLIQQIEWINSLEKNYPVDKYRCCEVDVWPVFRFHWYLQFKSKEVYFSGAGQQIKEPAQTPLLKNIIRKFRNKKLFVKSLGEKTKYDVLIYSRNSEYTEKVNGKWMNRYVDPYLEYLKGKTFLKIEEGEWEKSKESPFAAKVLPFVHFKYEHLLRFPDFEVKIFQETKSMLEEMEEELKQKLNIPKFISGMITISYYREYFKMIFRHYQPKYAWMVDYFSSEGFGMMLAAHDCGVRSVDLQHGKQGIYHTMYTHFTKVPTKGYNVLPNYFFNWGNESVEAIQKHSDFHENHIPVVIGNPWVAGWLSGKFTSGNGQQLEQFKKYKKVFLFSLQPVEDTLPEHLTELINASSEETIWLMRFHPAMKRTDDFFMKRGINLGKVEYELSSSLPLMELLNVVHLHFTSWSSVCFEAALAGIHTVIVHPMGVKLYQQQIQEEIFFNGSDLKSCDNAIHSAILNNHPLTDFIICEEKVIQNHINLFFEKNVA